MQREHQDMHSKFASIQKELDYNNSFNNDKSSLLFSFESACKQLLERDDKFNEQTSWINEANCWKLVRELYG
jgi:hypothetical protein